MFPLVYHVYHSVLLLLFILSILSHFSSRSLYPGVQNHTYIYIIFFFFQLTLPECWGRTPLHQAAKGGHVRCVELLLEKKANVNCLDEKNISPLLLASKSVRADDISGIKRYLLFQNKWFFCLKLHFIILEQMLFIC